MVSFKLNSRFSTTLNKFTWAKRSVLYKMYVASASNSIVYSAVFQEWYGGFPILFQEQNIVGPSAVQPFIGSLEFFLNEYKTSSNWLRWSLGYLPFTSLPQPIRIHKIQGFL